MNLVPHRLVPLLFLFLLSLAGTMSAASNPPVFLSGTSSTDTNPYYPSFNSIPVGKTLVIPIPVSGSGPLIFSLGTTTPAISPIIKTGYPLMRINVSYSGTTGSLGTLYSFTGGADGANPYSGLTLGPGGDLVGTTETGGTSNFGTAYRITTTGSPVTLHTFTSGSDGANPYAGLVTGTGNDFFGTTYAGGSGFGTVYHMFTSGSLDTLHAFTGGADGGNPYGGVITGTDSLLYGTTKNGANGFGTVYQLAQTGSLNTLYVFTDGTDGAHPQSQLVQGNNGNFYGTAVAGGASSVGTVFEISATGTFTTLHSFTGGSDGGNPYGSLIKGSGGVFYGTTETDGTGHFGTVFFITSTGTVSTLHSFTGGADGGNPFAGVVLASDGNLYGTTTTGGLGFGTIYRLSTTGSFTTIYSFTGGNDGANPYAPLLEAVAGDLFGTTKAGGTSNHGTVFQIPLPNAGAFSGAMSFALLRDIAPTATSYIAGFAQAGYYNGLDFFRITNLAASAGGNSFIAQGGDPTNTGTGTPGFSFDNEFNPALIFNGQGQLALANSGINQNTFKGSNGSQFFITQGPTRNLDFGYTIFGQMLTGFDVMQKVMSVPLKSTTDGSTPSAPASPVVMDSVTVTEDNTDAILFVTGAGYAPAGGTVTVNATDPSGNKGVTLSGTIPTRGLSIPMTTAMDTVDDPPFLLPVPDLNVGLHQNITLPVRAQDLEFDYLTTAAFSLSFLSGASVTLNSLGNAAVVRPSSFEPVSSVSVGMEVEQPYVSVERSNPVDMRAVDVGFGMGVLIPVPALLDGTAGGPIVSSTTVIIAGSATATGTTIATFVTSDPLAVPADYTPGINWGDGTLTSGSANVSVVRSHIYPTGYDIIAPAGHTYANPGIYPLNVMVTASNGGVLEVRNTANVGSGPIYVQGLTFTAPKGVANGLVATFVDHSPNLVSADFEAVINWGDGSVGMGAVRGNGSNYQVYATHRYYVGITYPVDVTIKSRINSTSGYGWSIAESYGIASHQPPVAQSHVFGQISAPGFNGLLLDEEVTLFNSGNLPSGPISLRFYLSPDSNTVPINSAAIPLGVGGRATYNTPSIAPGSAIEGAVSNITLPANAQTRGKYIIMQVITSDPIANHMPYPHAFADPFPLIF